LVKPAPKTRAPVQAEAVEDGARGGVERDGGERLPDAVLGVTPAVDAFDRVHRGPGRSVRRHRRFAALDDRLGDLEHEDIVAVEEDAARDGAVEGREGEREQERDDAGAVGSGGTGAHGGNRRRRADPFTAAAAGRR
jgi:hypothetical protein